MLIYVLIKYSLSSNIILYRYTATLFNLFLILTFLSSISSLPSPSSFFSFFSFFSSLFFSRRTLICRLLGNIYLQNDLVFSSEAAGNNRFYPLVCGLSATPSPLLHTHDTPSRSSSPTPPLPSTLSNKEDDIGKVFNLYTRLMYSGSPSSLQLRTMLWGFLRAEVLDMKMVLGTTGYFKKKNYFDFFSSIFLFSNYHLFLSILFHSIV